MSYGFNVRAATVAAAVAAIGPEFDKVVSSHPVHAADREAAVAAATAIAALVSDAPEGQEVSISVSGWLQWSQVPAEGEAPSIFTGASVTASVTTVTKEG
jgi:alkanesulfonate monooxygenase SsuD/methylene tetrahydromethanopterin reductase-like flavin-dependent oxidoreductase (luciferase family)